MIWPSKVLPFDHITSIATYFGLDLDIAYLHSQPFYYAYFWHGTYAITRWWTSHLFCFICKQFCLDSQCWVIVCIILCRLTFFPVQSTVVHSVLKILWLFFLSAFMLVLMVDLVWNTCCCSVFQPKACALPFFKIHCFSLLIFILISTSWFLIDIFTN
jgi:hypothetical protein